MAGEGGGLVSAAVDASLERVLAMVDERAEEIVAFASEFDPQPFHLDEEAARGTLFAGLVASGWHTAAITMRLLVEGGAPIAGGVIGTGVEITTNLPGYARTRNGCASCAETKA